MSNSENIVNDCIAKSLSEAVAAHAVFEAQGTDSFVASALAVTIPFRAYRMFYDSDPTGGGSRSSGTISTTECIHPQIWGSEGGSIVFRERELV